MEIEGVEVGIVALELFLGFYRDVLGLFDEHVEESFLQIGISMFVLGAQDDLFVIGHLDVDDYLCEDPVEINKHQVVPQTFHHSIGDLSHFFVNMAQVAEHNDAVVMD